MTSPDVVGPVYSSTTSFWTIAPPVQLTCTFTMPELELILLIEFTVVAVDPAKLDTPKFVSALSTDIDTSDPLRIGTMSGTYM